MSKKVKVRIIGSQASGIFASPINSVIEIKKDYAKKLSDAREVNILETVDEPTQKATKTPPQDKMMGGPSRKTEDVVQKLPRFFR